MCFKSYKKWVPGEKYPNSTLIVHLIPSFNASSYCNEVRMAWKGMCQLTNGVEHPLDATLRRLLQSGDSKPQLGFHRDGKNSGAEAAAADCNLSTTAIQLRRTHCSPRAGQRHPTTTTITTIAPLGCRSKHDEAVGHRAHYCLHLFCQSNRSVGEPLPGKQSYPSQTDLAT